MADKYRRRQFLETLAVGTAGWLSAGYTATAKGFAANETIGVAAIGAGGRCRHLMRSLAQIPGVKLTAVCDVWDQHLEQGRRLADPKAAAAKDYRRLLDRPDVDAVLIGAPDHWHAPMTIDACAAGKDVYVEKPLTHKLSEGAALLEAQRRSGRIVQVGMQQRSMPQFQQARQIVQSGQLGQVRKVHMTWNRNTPRGQQRNLGIDPQSVDWKGFLGDAPPQPFDEYRFRNWRWFWDFGGGIFADLMVHFVDVAHWLLDLEHPLTAASIGDHFMAQDLWETPDTVQTLLRYGDVQVYFQGTFVNARHGAMLELMGTDATLYLDRGRYEVHPERHRRLNYSELVLGEGPRGADSYATPNAELLHLVNWVECLRSRQQPSAPVAAGVQAAAAAHLANQSLRSGQTATWEAVTSDDENRR